MRTYSTTYYERVNFYYEIPCIVTSAIRQNGQKWEHVSRSEILFQDLDFCYFFRGQNIRYSVIKFCTLVE
jgi:hypothetical protein